MENISYPVFAAISAGLWVIGGLLLFFGSRKIRIIGNVSVILGLAIFSIFIALKWIYLDRPLMKTLGETRLWYTLFLVVLSYLVYIRWKYLVVLWFGTFMAIAFLWINFRYPESFDKELMPVLQSPWFVPHVVIYILSYALLGLSAITAFIGIFSKKSEEYMILANNMVYLGFSLLTIGLVFGVFWAKEAWGHYWTWNTKETWAFLTWIIYLGYIHYRYYQPNRTITHLWILWLAFVVLIVCWLGLGYLPIVQDSIHVFTS